MDNRFINFMIFLAVITGFLFTGYKGLGILATRSAAASAARARSELASIRSSLGTTATKTMVGYSVTKGGAVKDTVDHIARQSGLPISYTGSAVARNGYSYSGELDGALLNIWINEGLVFRRTRSGNYVLTPK